MFRRLHAFGFGEPADVLLGRRIEIDQADGIAGTDRNLLHVNVRRVEQRAAFGHRHRGDGARHVLGAQRRAFERIDGDIDPRAVLVPDRLADEQHGRLVSLALSDHDRAVDRELVELPPHGVDCRLIGRLLVAATAQSRRRHRGPLGHPHELDVRTRSSAKSACTVIDGTLSRRSLFMCLPLTPHLPRCRAAPFGSRPGDNGKAQLYQFFSIRMTCGFPKITLSRSTAASALRTASSVVA